MNEQELVERLVGEHGYPVHGAKLIAAKILTFQPATRAAFEAWWASGLSPTLEVEGYTFQRLTLEQGQQPVAAFLTLDWLLREPAQAVAILRRGHDEIVSSSRPALPPPPGEEPSTAVTRRLDALPSLGLPPDDVPADEAPPEYSESSTLSFATADGAVLAVEPQPVRQSHFGSYYRSVDGQWTCLLFDSPITLDTAARVAALLADRPPDSPLVIWPTRKISSPNLGVVLAATPDMQELGTALGRPEATPAPARPIGFMARAVVARQVAAAVEWLERHGIAVSYLNPATFVVNFDTHRAQYVAWAELTDDGGKAATAWLAPEQRTQTPAVSSAANRYSLALLLHWLLLGRESMAEVQPSRGVREDDSNKLDEHSLTPRLQRLFLQTFEDGAHDPSRRPSPSEWVSGLTELMDRTVPCSNPDCPLGALAVPESHHFTCPWCGAPYRHDYGCLPFLRFYRPDEDAGSYVDDQCGFVGYAGRFLFRHHAYAEEPFDERPDQIIGQIIGHEGQWYFRNLSPEGMVLLSTGSQAKAIPSGSGVLLDEGARVLLGERGRARVLLTQIINVEHARPS